MKGICFRNITHYAFKSKCMSNKKSIFTIPNKEVRIYNVSVISTRKLLEKPLLVEQMPHEINLHVQAHKNNICDLKIWTIFPPPLFVNHYLFIYLFILFIQFTTFSNFLIHSKSCRPTHITCVHRRLKFLGLYTVHE